MRMRLLAQWLAQGSLGSATVPTVDSPSPRRHRLPHGADFFLSYGKERYAQGRSG